MPHCPKRGDIISIDLNPPQGREIAKVRPALVLSPFDFNRATGLAFICPITTKPSDNPFEVRFSGKKTVGAVLSHLARSLDWRARGSTLIEKAPDVIVDDVTAKLAAIIGS